MLSDSSKYRIDLIEQKGHKGTVSEFSSYMSTLIFKHIITCISLACICWLDPHSLLHTLHWSLRQLCYSSCLTLKSASFDDGLWFDFSRVKVTLWLLHFCLFPFCLQKPPTSFSFFLHPPPLSHSSIFRTPLRHTPSVILQPVMLIHLNKYFCLSFHNSLTLKQSIPDTSDGLTPPHFDICWLSNGSSFCILYV